MKIFSWFSPELYERYKALEDEAYKLRRVVEPFHQTDIRYDTDDIALYKRLDRNHRWQRVEIHDLPDVVVDPDLLVRPTSGAVGRARLNSKRKRNSSTEDDNTSKNLKPSSSPGSNSQKIDDVETTKKTNVDVGRYTEHHAYSPVRIAPTKHSLITTTPLTLNKLKQPTLNFSQKSEASKTNFQ